MLNYIKLIAHVQKAFWLLSGALTDQVEVVVLFWGTQSGNVAEVGLARFNLKKHFGFNTFHINLLKKY